MRPRGPAKVGTRLSQRLLPLTLPLPPTPRPSQADSNLSQKLGGDDFKEFISQHEMTLVNFFAP